MRRPRFFSLIWGSGCGSSGPDMPVAMPKPGWQLQRAATPCVDLTALRSMGGLLCPYAGLTALRARQTAGGHGCGGRARALSVCAGRRRAAAVRAGRAHALRCRNQRLADVRCAPAPWREAVRSIESVCISKGRASADGRAVLLAGVLSWPAWEQCGVDFRQEHLRRTRCQRMTARTLVAAGGLVTAWLHQTPRTARADFVHLPRLALAAPHHRRAARGRPPLSAAAGRRRRRA